MMTDCLIWSHEHSAWWRPKSAGYTNSINDAGRYTRDEALAICLRARDGWCEHGLPSEIPVRVEDIDMLEMNIAARNAARKQ